MTDKKRRLSDVVVAGRDYPAKVKIKEVLDAEVEIVDFDHVVIMKEVTLQDGSKGEIADADYYNVVVRQADLIKTFSTGAKPIVVILERLDKAQLPLWATFKKEGQTYVVK